MNLVQEYDKASIAQFYIHGRPDKDFCDHYFGVSDRDALNAFLHKKARKNTLQGQVKSAEVVGGQPERKIRRSCRNLLLRDLVWMSFAWWKRDFERFLTDFSPQVVLLQAGDAPFMFAIARKIAKKFAVPLLMYNSENYVLKQYMYNGAQHDGIWHTLLQRRLKKQYACFMKRADFCIYSMEQLEADYQQAYPHPGKSTTLYTVSDLQAGDNVQRTEDKVFHLVYCGNLGVGRVKPLAELAATLHEVDPAAVLDIYGRFVSPQEQEYVCAVPGVEYHGVVDYDKVPDILRQADMIVHCENKNRLANLRTAFSTKIADSLAIGTPFLVFAVREYPFVQYLLRNQCAHVASDLEELKTVLHNCRHDLEYRRQFVENALATAERNHSVSGNCRKFNTIVETVCDETKRAER